MVVSLYYVLINKEKKYAIDHDICTFMALSAVGELAASLV